MRKYGIPRPIVNIIKHEGVKAGVTVNLMAPPSQRQGYIIAPTLFNINFNSALEPCMAQWKPTL